MAVYSYVGGQTYILLGRNDGNKCGIASDAYYILSWTENALNTSIFTSKKKKAFNNAIKAVSKYQLQAI